MTVRTTISLRRPLLAQIDVCAQELGLSRSGFLALAAEDLIRKLDNRKFLRRLDEAYGDSPDAEEQKLQQEMRRLQRRQVERYL